MEKIYWTNKNFCFALTNILFETCGLEFLAQEQQWKSFFWSFREFIVHFFGNDSRNFGKTIKRDYVIDFIDYVQPLYVECTL